MISIIKQIGIFSIIAQIMIHFCSNKKYENYIKVLAGLISIVIIAGPILSIFHKGISTQMLESIETYDGKLENMLDRVNYDITYDESIVDNLVQEELQQKISEAMLEYGFAVQAISIDEKEQTLSIVVKENSKSKKITVDPVTIEPKEEAYKQLKKDEELAQKISRKLGVTDGYLEVFITEQ